MDAVESSLKLALLSFDVDCVDVGPAMVSLYTC